MDYSQSRQQPGYPNDSPAFFTSGAGTDNEEFNPDPANNNLDLSNTEASWMQGQEQGHDKRAIGVSARESAEMPLPPAESKAPVVQELGQIASLEPVPISPLEQPTNPTGIETVSGPSLGSVKTVEGQLSNGSVAAIDAAIAVFNRGGSPDEFYAEIRGKDGAVAANLQNSYNRELGAA